MGEAGERSGLETSEDPSAKPAGISLDYHLEGGRPPGVGNLKKEAFGFELQFTVIENH